MKGGGYAAFLNELKTKGQVNCVARFMIVDGDRITSNVGEAHAFEELVDYCRQQNKKRGIPCFIILNNPNFEYVACLHAKDFTGQSSEKFICDTMGFERVADFKKKEDLKRGLSPKVEKIILSGLTKVPEIISEKVEIIDFKKLWKKKTEIQKQKIYNFFGMETADIEKISRKKVIFLSQPLEEDESLTHEETVELYRKIFKNYNENDILFKLHPRGIFTYKNEFPQIEIFTSKIPFQIFEYMGVDFDTVATIYSTAVWDIKNAKKIDFFGTKVHPKLLAQFGNIER